MKKIKKSQTVYNDGSIIIMWDSQQEFTEYVAINRQYKALNTFTVDGELTLRDAQIIAEEHSTFLHKRIA